VDPVIQRDAKPGDPLWLIEAQQYGDSNNALRLTQVSNLTSGPTFSVTTRLEVPDYGIVWQPRQPGSFTSLFLDNRLLGASEINGQIVTAHSAGIGSYDRARVYQVDVSSAAPVLAQTITIDAGNGVDTYFPAVDMNENGDIGITYMESSAREYMSMYVTGQHYADCAWSCGSYQTPAQVRTGTSAYTLSRAGDYGGVAVDPSDLTTFWAFNEYKGNDPLFNTGVAHFGVSAEAGAGLSGRAHNHATTSTRPRLPAGSALQETAAPLVADSQEPTGLVGPLSATPSWDPAIAALLVRTEEASTWDWGTAYSSEEKDVGVRAGFQKALSPVSGNREAGGVECALFWIGTPECA
jgi:hypothetical protein